MARHLYHFFIILLIALIPFLLGALNAHAEEVPPANSPTFYSLGSTYKGKPVKMLVHTAWPLRAKKPVDMVVQLWTDDGPIPSSAFKESNGAKLHLFMLSPDFKEFYYLIPSPTPNVGEYRVSFVPRSKVPLRAWLEFTTDDGVKMSMADVNYERMQPVPPSPAQQYVQINQEGLTFSIDFDDELLVGKPVNGMLVVYDKGANKPYHDLEAVRGSYVHAVAFGPDFGSINHIAIPDAVAKDPQTKDAGGGGPAFRFRFAPMQPGMMSVFALYHVHGHDVFIPFLVRVGTTTQKVRSQDLENKSRPEQQDPPEK